MASIGQLIGLSLLTYPAIRLGLNQIRNPQLLIPQETFNALFKLVGLSQLGAANKPTINLAFGIVILVLGLTVLLGVARRFSAFLLALLWLAFAVLSSVPFPPTAADAKRLFESAEFAKDISIVGAYILLAILSSGKRNVKKNVAKNTLKED